MLASFWDYIGNPANIGTVAVIMGCMIPIVAIVTGIWQSVEKTRSNNALKRAMLDRGMSADDIERVMAAGEADDEDEEDE